MRTTELAVRTGGSRGLTDLTTACQRFLGEVAPDEDGLLSVFVAHATAGLAIVELGAGTEADLMTALDALLPRDDRWLHDHGPRGHGADHVAPALVSPSVVVPVVGGRLALGTWQSIALVDLNADKPLRLVRLSFVGG
jgi:secondary thiamine-phosphate synthase enzyme